MSNTNEMTKTATAAPYILRTSRNGGIGVHDFREAGRVFIERDMDGRGSAYYCGGKGDILDAVTGAIVARVSPNGRVWLGAKWVSGATPIHEAYRPMVSVS